ncbi:MAG: Crp/Fnr family transcriptional regulator [Methylococcaceae bacterium]
MTYSLSDKRTLLTKNIFFKDISAKELDKILAFSSERHFTHGQIIFQKGDAGDTLLAVLDGKVRISTSSDDGKEIILNTLFKGEMFGEIAFIDGMERSATATSTDESTLLTIRRTDFIPFLKNNPELSIQWLKILCSMLRGTNDRLEVVGLLSVAVSLARFLIKSAETMGEETAGGLYLDWKKTQQEIGNEIGTSRESINKQLNKWKKQGLVSLGGQSLSVTILDSEALQDIADGLE